MQLRGQRHFILSAACLSVGPASGLRTSPESSRGTFCEANCFTHWERQNLARDAAGLAPGLRALRAPGCVPPNQLVVTGGYFRSGSTTLFNIARLWMALAFPDETSTGFQYWEGGVRDHLVHRRTIVSKEHDHPQAVREADVLLMSRRAVWESLDTRLRMRHNVSFNGRDLREECNLLRTQQAGMYHSRAKAGKRVAYDVLLYDMLRDPKREIAAVAKALGICEGARKDPALLDFLKAMVSDVRERYGESGEDNRITMMHNFEDRAQKRKSRQMLELATQTEDKACWRWAEADAHPGANDLIPASEARTEFE